MVNFFRAHPCRSFFRHVENVQSSGLCPAFRSDPDIQRYGIDAHHQQATLVGHFTVHPDHQSDHAARDLGRNPPELWL